MQTTTKTSHSCVNADKIKLSADHSCITVNFCTLCEKCMETNTNGRWEGEGGGLRTRHTNYRKKKVPEVDACNTWSGFQNNIFQTRDKCQRFP